MRARRRAGQRGVADAAGDAECADRSPSPRGRSGAMASWAAAASPP